MEIQSRARHIGLFEQDELRLLGFTHCVVWDIPSGEGSGWDFKAVKSLEYAIGFAKGLTVDDRIKPESVSIISLA